VITFFVYILSGHTTTTTGLATLFQ